MVTRQYVKAWLGLVGLILVMGLLLFVPAATIRYWQAWAYLAVYFGGSLWLSLYLLREKPDLLERRMRGGPLAEKKASQKVIMLFTSVGFVAMLVVPAVDHRLGWSRAPLAVVALGDIMIAIWWFIAFIVFRENSFAAATIDVVPDQHVVSTGPYAVVRHPMYAGASLLLVGSPLALGSYWGLLGPAAMVPFLIWRLFDEERFLAEHLPGYTVYCARVHWRLIPGVF